MVKTTMMALRWYARRACKRVYFTARGVLLSLAYPWTAIRRGRISLGPPGKILVVSQPRIGDAALSIPFFSVLGAEYPEAQVMVLANPYVKEVFDLLPQVDRVIISSGERSFSTPAGLLKLSRDLRREEVDLLIDLNTDGRLDSALLSALSGATRSIGFRQSGRGFFFHTALPLPEGRIHMADLLLSTLHPLGVSEEKGRNSFRFPMVRWGGLRDQLGSMGISDKEILVGLHPGGHHPTQRWPAQYFAELADKIRGEGIARAVLCGGAGDQELIARIAEQMGSEPDILPPLPSAKALAAFLQACRLLVCNNSGPLHLASAVGTPTVSFMGPTHFSRWRPIGKMHVVFRRDELPCIGCNLGYCRVETHACMRLIHPDVVFEAVKGLLTAGPGNRLDSCCIKEVST